jgi:hypothetical protein
MKVFLHRVLIAFLVTLYAHVTFANDMTLWPNLFEKVILEESWQLENHNSYLQSINERLGLRDKVWQLDENRLDSDASQIVFDHSIMSFSGERGSGGGGDALYCSKEDKLYSLDYKLSEHKSIAQPLRGLSCSRTIKRIYHQLKHKSPLLARGLQEFMTGMSLSFDKDKTQDTIHYYHVFLSKRPLLEVKDEKIPHNTQLCSQERGKLYQAGVRLSLPEHTFISFDADIFNELKKSPFQCSYLILHEWTRDFIFDSDKNRRFVHYLHSQEFLTRSEMHYPGFSEIAVKTLKRIKLHDFSTYLTFLRDHGDIAASHLNHPTNLKHYQGVYEFLKPHCTLHVKSTGKNELKMTLKKESESCNLKSSINYNFTCSNFKCVSSKKLTPQPNCKRPQIVMKLSGFFNLMDMGIQCEEQVTYNGTWVKKGRAKEIKTINKLFENL